MLRSKFRDFIRRIARRAGDKLYEMSDALEVKELLQPGETSLPPGKKDDLFYSDQPIHTSKDDLFNRADFAARVAETIAARKDSESIVLGIYGAWGDGKTSVLEMMSEALEAHDDIIILKFNPWLFQSEELLLRGFFASLAHVLGKSLPSAKEKIGKILDNYGSILSLAAVSIGGVVTINPAEAVKTIGKNLSQTDLNGERRKIEAILEENKRKVVVFIDDIDRLDKEETHAIFKLVKLSASFRHTTYVLAFDYSVVSASIGERYGEGGREAGSAFIEKIIQVPLHLPQADKSSLRQLAFQGVDTALSMAGITLEESQAQEFTLSFLRGLQQKLTTPRLAKRYGNALLFTLPLLKGEVNPIDLMLIEGIRVFYPEVYLFIRDNRDIFLDGVNNNFLSPVQSSAERDFAVLFKNKFSDLDNDELMCLMDGVLEPLFPRTKHIRCGDAGDSKWDKEQRICSFQYFPIYFMYSLPKGSLSDNLFRVILDSFHSLNEDEQNNILRGLSEQQTISSFIQKLHTHVKNIDITIGKAFIYAFARNLKLIPRRYEQRFYIDTWERVGKIISEILLKIEKDKRFSLVKDILNITTIDFCIQMYCCFRYSEYKSEEFPVLSATDEEQMRKILAEKIHKEDSITPIYKAYPRDALSLYWLWKEICGSESLEVSLLSHMNESKTEVEDFLEYFAMKRWGIVSSEPVRSGLERDEYDSISTLIQPEFIMKKLKDIYGDELDNPQHKPDTKFSPTRITAHQFSCIYNKLKEDSEKQLKDSSEVEE